MKDLAIAYFEWHQEITYNRHTYKFEKGKGIDMIRTRGGELYSPDAWMQAALGYIKKSGKTDLYLQVKEYVIKNHLWLKKGEVIQHSLDCILHESYKHWDDFSYQERLKL